MSDIKAAGMICQIIKPILTIEDGQYLKGFLVKNYNPYKSNQKREYSQNSMEWNQIGSFTKVLY